MNCYIEFPNEISQTLLIEINYSHSGLVEMTTDVIVQELIKMKEDFTGKKYTPLYETQTRALKAGLLEKGDNFVIIAPTASGKTLNAEFVIYQCLKNHQKVVYLTPTTSLCSDKEKEFAYLEKKGYKITASGNWRDADLVITTFEALYRVALRNFRAIEQFRLAVIDEFHILYDPTRGFNLEKAITFLKKNKYRIICLSATFEDRNEIRQWLEAELVHVPEEFRKVPLKKDILDLSQIREPTKRVLALQDWLVKSKILYPYIIFCSRKDWARSRALQITTMIPKEGVISDKKTLQKEFFEALPYHRELTSLETDLLRCLEYKVAFHHSGLHKRFRDLVEEKFVKREVDFLFATTGIAYGINFPAKTVVLHDLTLFQQGKNKPIPVYMFIQMSGRAGRPQFGKEGYAYITANNAIDIMRGKKMLEGKLERAESHIANDDYFQKFLLELIYSGRKKEEEIIGFLKGTFYYFQSLEESKKSVMEFDFGKILKRQLEYLTSQGFVEYLGRPGFKLLDLGEVTIDFLFTTYKNYELRCFIELNKFLEKEQKISPDFELILKLSREFDGARLYKIPHEKSKDIQSFFENRGVTKPGHPEYSSYSIFFGWMENKPEHQIEMDLKVWTSALENVSEELHNLLNAYEALAKKKNIDIPEGWRDFKDRILYGVRKDELPFVKRKGIKRNVVRNLCEYCQSVLKGPIHRYRGTMIEVLRSFCKDKGESFALTTLIKDAPNIGPSRASTILGVVKEYKG